MEITDTVAALLNDIENEGPFGYFVDRDVPGQFFFHNCITGADYVFTLNELLEVWEELNI